jgi:xylose isomerase
MGYARTNSGEVAPAARVPVRAEERNVAQAFFPDVTGPIPFGGLDTTDPLAFRVYEPDRLVLGKRMADHLRIGVCLWHSFAWDGRDMFGVGTLDRPWLDPAADPMAAARQKMAVAFEFIEKLGMPYYCFHDRDVAPRVPPSPSSGPISMP